MPWQSRAADQRESSNALATIRPLQSQHKHPVRGCVENKQAGGVLRRFALLLTLLIGIHCYAAEVKVDASRSGEYIGQNVLACGQVTQVKSFAKGVYLNYGPRFPSEHLTGVIWSDEVSNFVARLGKLERLEGRRVCVRGEVSTYKAHLQIHPRKPANVVIL